jgi:hypothetical protein
MHEEIKSKLSPNLIFSLLYLFMGVGCVIISISEGYSLAVDGFVVSGLGMDLPLPNMNIWLFPVTPETTGRRVEGGFVSAIS